MTIRTRCDPDLELPGVLVAVAEGTLDVAGAERLWEVVSSRLTRTTPSLLIDLAAVPLITSAGVGTLVRLLHRVRSLGGGMAVYGATERVREVIEAVMLEEILALSSDLAEARGRLHR